MTLFVDAVACVIIGVSFCWVIVLGGCVRSGGVRLVGAFFFIFVLDCGDPDGAPEVGAVTGW